MENASGSRRMSLAALLCLWIVCAANVTPVLAQSSSGPDQTPSSGASRETSGAFQVEVFGGATFHLGGSRAIVITPTQIADSGAHNKLPTVGLALNSWFGKRKIVGSFVDFSYVDGGKATASVGPLTSEVTSRLLDFHGGFQAQAPFRRFRPYASVGGGLARITSTGSISLAGAASSFSPGITTASLTYGGGLRAYIGRTWGIRGAVEGVTLSRFQTSSVSGLESGRATYGRVIFGAFWSSR
jgi:hypothetical protein